MIVTVDSLGTLPPPTSAPNRTIGLQFVLEALVHAGLSRAAGAGVASFASGGIASALISTNSTSTTAGATTGRGAGLAGGLAGPGCLWAASSPAELVFPSGAARRRVAVGGLRHCKASPGSSQPASAPCSALPSSARSSRRCSQRASVPSRVAIARTLANQPTLILEDEPAGNLDEQTGDHIIELISSLSRHHSTTILVVTHDRALANKTARRFRLQQGKLTEEPVRSRKCRAGHRLSAGGGSVGTPPRDCQAVPALSASHIRTLFHFPQVIAEPSSTAMRGWAP
ncbi:hypothetical protein Q9R30_17440 [Arthrobacter sp. AB6]|uniref:hypothetical protein n=1 Tax=Arthrobacter sp. AB6 TaxID=2962570 RepID=UPI00288228F8|nr:hypothetical protein [Arthrobacter sp. AB6]MDT0197138.1 hypothetical protein [Arthrobacter sp. AB6]